MAYTGRGTKADPFIVNNWTDLMSLCHIPNRWITLDPNAEDKVMDLNDMGYGLWKDFNMYSNITGNGWTIRNLHLGAYSIACGENDITGLHFVNMVGSGPAFSGGSNFTNCTFSGLLTGSACFCRGTEFLYPVFRNCSISLTLHSTGQDVLFSGKSQLLGCRLDLHGDTEGLQLTDLGLLSTCSISGELVLGGGELRLDPVHGCCAYMLEVGGTGKVIADKAANYMVLADASLLADTLDVELTGTNWHLLTTQEMQDAEYLIGVLGFPCTAEE